MRYLNKMSNSFQKKRNSNHPIIQLFSSLLDRYSMDYLSKLKLKPLI